MAFPIPAWLQGGCYRWVCCKGWQWALLSWLHCRSSKLWFLWKAKINHLEAQPTRLFILRVSKAAWEALSQMVMMGSLQGCLNCGNCCCCFVVFFFLNQHPFIFLISHLFFCVPWVSCQRLKMRVDSYINIKLYNHLDHYLASSGAFTSFQDLWVKGNFLVHVRASLNCW